MSRDLLDWTKLTKISGRAIAQAVSRWLPTAEARGVQPGSGHVGFCDGKKWCWGRFSPRTSVSPANLHSIYFSTIIFTITRGWHICQEWPQCQKPNNTKKQNKDFRAEVINPIFLLYRCLYLQWINIIIVVIFNFVQKSVFNYGFCFTSAECKFIVLSPYLWLFTCKQLFRTYTVTY
jgi:hypothetical protein